METTQGGSAGNRRGVGHRPGGGSGLLDAGRRVLAADLSQERLDVMGDIAPPERLGRVRLDVSDEAQVVDALARQESAFGPIGGLDTARWGRGAAPHAGGEPGGVLRRGARGRAPHAQARTWLHRQHHLGVGHTRQCRTRGLRRVQGRVVTLTRVMAVELAEYGIRVNAVAPGPIETPLVGQMHTEQARAPPGGAAASLCRARRAEWDYRLVARRVQIQLCYRAGHLRGRRLHRGRHVAHHALSLSLPRFHSLRHKRTETRPCDTPPWIVRCGSTSAAPSQNADTPGHLQPGPHTQPLRRTWPPRAAAAQAGASCSTPWSTRWPRPASPMRP